MTLLLLNFNGLEDLETCLSSLRAAHESGEAEVLVVDNGSTDGSCAWVRERHPWARLMEHGRNWGFAQGINRALAGVQTPYFALLNNDTEVEHGWIAPLLEAMENQPDVAAVQARIMLFDRRHIIQSAGGGMTVHGYGFDRGYGRWFRAPFDQQAEVFFVSAGAAIYRRSAWDSVGGFDPAYFMYHEDVDWSWRAWLAGWRLLYEPRSVVFHKMGSTTARVLGFSARQALGERHRIRTLLKLAAMPSGLRRIYGGLRTRDWRRARLLLRCLGWNLLHGLGTLRLRASARPRVTRESVETRIHPYPRAPDLLAAYRPASALRLRERLRHGEWNPGGSFVIGLDEEAWLGIGWHVPEPAWAGAPLVRWMSEEAEVYGIAPLGTASAEVELVRWADANGQAQTGHLEIWESRGPADRLLGKQEFRLGERGPVRIAVPIPTLRADELLRLRILCPEVGRRESSPEDTRELSVGLRAWRFSAG